jgi:hypothetical protein
MQRHSVLILDPNAGGVGEHVVARQLRDALTQDVNACEVESNNLTI